MNTSSDNGALREKILQRLDFLSDHWVNGDDKPPFSFGGWRDEVADELLKLLSTPSPKPNPEGWEGCTHFFWADESPPECFGCGLTKEDIREKRIQRRITEALAQQRQATLEFIEKNKKENECGNEDCEVCMWEENRGYNQALDDLKAYLTKGERK